MPELLTGAPVVKHLNEQLHTKVAALQKRGTMPTLAILRVGERPDDIAYEKGATKRCANVGVEVENIILPEDVSQDELIRTIEDLNQNDMIHGVLMFRPLPDHIDETTVCNTLAPEKDIDGITDISNAGVFTGQALGYPPCTPQACMEMLDYFGIDPKGRKVTIVGRSLVVGKPAAMMLIQKNATVTVCHTRTIDMPAACREAEILIAAAGKAKMIDESFLSKGQIVLDVGINVDEAGNLCGDVDFEQAQGIVKAITPVPGGVGTVTTSVLVKHVVDAAEKAERM